MTCRRRTTALTGATIAATGLLLATGPASAAPRHAPPAYEGMERMHELMTEDNPGMARMHQRMTEGNPGLIRMHQRMMSGTGMSEAPSN